MCMYEFIELGNFQELKNYTLEKSSIFKHK